MTTATEPLPTRGCRQNPKDDYTQPCKMLPTVSPGVRKQWVEYTSLLGQQADLKPADQKVFDGLVKQLELSPEEIDLHKLVLAEAERLAAIFGQLEVRQAECDKAFAKPTRMNTYCPAIHDEQGRAFCAVQTCLDCERQLGSIQGTFPLLFGIDPTTVCAEQVNPLLANITNTMKKL